MTQANTECDEKMTSLNFTGFCPVGWRLKYSFWNKEMEKQRNGSLVFSCNTYLNITAEIHAHIETAIQGLSNRTQCHKIEIQTDHTFSLEISNDLRPKRECPCNCVDPTDNGRQLYEFIWICDDNSHEQSRYTAMRSANEKGEEAIALTLRRIIQILS